MNVSWVNIEGRHHKFNMPCFICHRPGTWPVVRITSREEEHGFTVTVCSEECLAMTEIVTFDISHREMADKVVSHRDTYMYGDSPSENHI